MKGCLFGFVAERLVGLFIGSGSQQRHTPFVRRWNINFLSHSHCTAVSSRLFNFKETLPRIQRNRNAYRDIMAASWTLPLASFVRGNVGIGVIGPFFGSARLRMLVMEKLVYADPVDVLLCCSGGVFGGLSLESALWLNAEWRCSCCWCCCWCCVEYWNSFRDGLWSSGRGDGSGLDTTLISTSTSCEDIFCCLFGDYRSFLWIVLSRFASVLLPGNTKIWFFICYELGSTNHFTFEYFKFCGGKMVSWCTD